MVKQFAVQPGWRLLMSDLGINPAHVLRVAGLPADLFTRKEACVNVAQYFALWRALESLSADPTLPLKVGQAVSAEVFDPAVFACLCSPNLNVALQRLAAFKRLIGPMVLQLEVSPSETRATLRCCDDATPVPASFALAELVFITQLSRVGTRHRVVPARLVLQEMPAGVEPYVAFWGTHPIQGDEIGITFSAEDGLRPFLTENDAMWNFFEEALRKRMSQLDATATMRDRVRALLFEALPAGQHSIEELAKRLAVSTRSLQRQLGEEDTCFKDVLNETRHELALHYLGKPVVAQGEIAYLLGFQDVNSFIRAFKGWTGVTPGSYRHDLGRAGAVGLH